MRRTARTPRCVPCHPGILSLPRSRDSAHQPLASSHHAAAHRSTAPPRSWQLTTSARATAKQPFEIPVLQGVELSIGQGEFVAIIGPSGCGKSTLLHLLATLDAPDSGEIRFEGHRIDNLPAAGRDILRNKYFGMVFQFYHLLPELTTLENVLVPAMIGEGVLGYCLHRRTQSRTGARDARAGRPGASAEAQAARAVRR